MTAPGPPGLGRGVIVNVGDPVPAPWADGPGGHRRPCRARRARRRARQRSDVVDALHGHWAARRPVVVALGGRPGRVPGAALGLVRRVPRRPLAARRPGSTWRTTGSTSWCGPTPTTPGAAASRSGGGAARPPRRARRRAPSDGEGRRAATSCCPTARRRGSTAARGATTSSPWPAAAPRSCPPRRSRPATSRPVPAARPRRRPSWRPTSWRPSPTGPGPARVIAPAGSGKTRVLTERLRHLVVDRGYEPGSVVAVAYNRKARDEMVGPHRRASGGRILTLNALGYGIVADGLGRRPEVRRGARGPPPARTARPHRRPPAQHRSAGALRRGAHHGPAGPARPARGRGRAGRRARAWPRRSRAYRAELRTRGVVDFDEQVLLAIELLLARRGVPPGAAGPAPPPAGRRVPGPDPGPRAAGAAAGGPGVRRVRRRRRRPGHLRPRRARRRGSSPSSRALLPRRRRARARGQLPLPAAGGRRGPPPAHPQPGAGAEDDPGRPGRRVRAAPSASSCGATCPQAGATELVDVVRGWLAEPSVDARRRRGADPGRLARCSRRTWRWSRRACRCRRSCGPTSSGRTGLRAALAYVRIAAAPDAHRPRRPGRGPPPAQPGPAPLDRQVARRGAGRSTTSCRRRSASTTPRWPTSSPTWRSTWRPWPRWRATAPPARCSSTSATRSGWPRPIDRLDATGGGEGQSHRDDLDALLQVADLHPDPAGFDAVAAGRAGPARPTTAGVTLSTVHRVKGREWPRVAVFGATDGVMPHRLARARPRSRRSGGSSTSPSPAASAGWRCWPTRPGPSPFLGRARPRRDARRAGRGRARRAAADDGARHVAPPAGPGPARGPGARRRRPTASGPEAARVEQALRAWRKERSAADGVPAYVVLNDRHLVGIAERRPRHHARAGRLPRHRPGQAGGLRRRAARVWWRRPPTTGDPADGGGYCRVACGRMTSRKSSSSAGPTRHRPGRPRGPRRDRERAPRRAARRGRAGHPARSGPQASMDEIAAEAGITKPILYSHFGDKAGLVHALAERVRPAAQPHGDRGADPLGRAPRRGRVDDRGVLHVHRARARAVPVPRAERPPRRRRVGSAAHRHRQPDRGVARQRAAPGRAPTRGRPSRGRSPSSA